jgi:ariadne-1
VIIDDVKKPKFKCIDGFMCDICCNDEKELQTLALACNHRFCKSCYEEYLTRKIVQEGESRKIQCPGNCSLIVNETTIEMVVSSAVLDKYLTKNLLLDTVIF